MKQFFWLLGILFLLLLMVVIGLAVFVSRFDPNQYREYIESLISQNTGLKTEIGHLSLDKGALLGIEAKPFTLRQAKVTEPLFSTQRVKLQVDLWSLLGKRLSLKVKTEDGVLNYTPEPAKSEKGTTLKGVKTNVETGFPLFFLKMKGEGRVLDPSQPDLQWRAEIDKSRHVNFHVGFQEEALTAKGEIYAGQKPPRFQAQLKLNGLKIPDVVKTLHNKTLDSQNEEIPLTGSMDGILEIRGAGKDSKEIEKSLLGKGGLDIHEGALLNFNIAHSILTRVTLLPGLAQVLTEMVPPPFQEALNSPTTTFELVEANFQIQGNQVQFASLMLKSTHYLVEGEGALDFEGNLDFKARLILLEEMSSFLIGRVRELSFLANEQGRVAIPFVYRGRWPSARPLPDLGFLAQRLIGNRGTELLEKGLAALSQFTARH